MLVKDQVAWRSIASAFRQGFHAGRTANAAIAKTMRAQSIGRWYSRATLTKRTPCSRLAVVELGHSSPCIMGVIINIIITITIMVKWSTSHHKSREIVLSSEARLTLLVSSSAAKAHKPQSLPITSCPNFRIISRVSHLVQELQELTKMDLPFQICSMDYNNKGMIIMVSSSSIILAFQGCCPRI